MTKAEVIAEIVKQTGIDRQDVGVTVEALFQVVKNKMGDGQNIYVRGFGSFVNKKRARKLVRNISKNEIMFVEAHYIPSFKPAKSFCQSIKNSEKVKMLNE